VMKDALVSVKSNADDHGVVGSKGARTLEQIKQMSKPAHAEGAESSQQAANQAQRKENSGKVSYCFRCKTKGHAIESCFATMHCDAIVQTTSNRDALSLEQQNREQCLVATLWKASVSFTSPMT
jgi:hypothetical protein